MSVAKSLSIVLIFSKKQLLVSLSFIAFFVSMSLISALTFMISFLLLIWALSVRPSLLVLGVKLGCLFEFFPS